MEFGLSNEQSILQDQTARFLREKIPLDAVGPYLKARKQIPKSGANSLISAFLAS